MVRQEYRPIKMLNTHLVHSETGFKCLRGSSWKHSWGESSSAVDSRASVRGVCARVHWGRVRVRSRLTLPLRALHPFALSFSLPFALARLATGVRPRLRKQRPQLSSSPNSVYAYARSYSNSNSKYSLLVLKCVAGVPNARPDQLAQVQSSHLMAPTRCCWPQPFHRDLIRFELSGTEQWAPHTFFTSELNTVVTRRVRVAHVPLSRRSKAAADW